MKASMLYRIAAVLLLLFAAGHTLGFRQSDPTWGVDALLSSMQSIHFDVQGFNRTYWDLFVAAGFSVGVLYLFAAILAWQLEIPLYHTHRLLTRDYSVLDCGSMDFNEAGCPLTPWRWCGRHLEALGRPAAERTALEPALRR